MDKLVCKFIPKGAIRKRQKSESSDEEPIKIIKKQKPNKFTSVESDSNSLRTNRNVIFDADRSAKQTIVTKDNATATQEIDTEREKDEQAIFERVQQQKKEFQEEDDDDGLYRGMNHYDTKEYKDTIIGKASSGFNRKGPMRAPSNIRSTTRWDYQPDICKDYKETGFCGFGDSCKFLHDRSDYKFGWQLEAEEKKHACGDTDEESDEDKYVIRSDDEDNDVPLHCPYCRGEFKQPVRSICGHVFCTECAVTMSKVLKNRCSACGQSTKGRFVNADDILSKIQKIEDRRAGKLDKEEDSDDDL